MLTVDFLLGLWKRNFQGNPSPPSPWVTANIGSAKFGLKGENVKAHMHWLIINLMEGGIIQFNSSFSFWRNLSHVQ